MKYQVSFSLKNNEKVFMNVVCCSCDGCFKGLYHCTIMRDNFINSKIFKSRISRQSHPEKL